MKIPGFYFFKPKWKNEWTIVQVCPLINFSRTQYVYFLGDEIEYPINSVKGEWGSLIKLPT